MKKKCLLVFLSSFMLLNFIKAQDCIDAVVCKIDSAGEQIDTIFCQILGEEDTYLTIDNGLSITTIFKYMVVDIIHCMRPMNAYETYLYKGLNSVSQDYFEKQNTAGYYMRKAATEIFVSTGLALVGGVSITLGFTLFDYNPVAKYSWIIGGGICMGASLFLAIVAWNQIYKAGKLLDLQKYSLYLAPTQEGNLGLQLRFK